LSPASRALRIVLALVIAVPLGQGGLCCCLLGAAPAAAAAARVQAEPVHGCCDAAPPDREPAPPGADTDRCDCPARADALVAAAPDAPLAAASPNPIASVPSLAGTTPSAAAASSLAAGGTRPDPVPKTPRYRALCALLC
jgi:hypothetical protein